MAGKPFFVIPLDLGTVATGNEVANRPATHLGEFNYRGMVWQSNGTSDLWVRGDFGSAKDIDFVGLLGSNAIPAATTIRIRLGDSQAEVDGTADYDSTALTFVDPTPIAPPPHGYHSHHELPSMVSKRWWRIDIAGHSGDFEGAKLVIGKKITASVYYETAWQRSIRDLGGVTFSRNGVPAQSLGEKLRATSFKMSWLTEAEMEGAFSVLDETIGKTSPVFVSFDPEATTYRQRRTFFGWLEDNPSMQKVRYQTFERNFSIISLF